ncbi:MFS transporter [Evansella sp. AB-rgal1]|uniref:MFS transporter n=1 Tax=Evansella sp. AB-rgal1 TaxID=3242696 RepID=UPI00359E2706
MLCFSYTNLKKTKGEIKNPLGLFFLLVKNINQIITNRAYVTFCFFMIFVLNLVTQLYLAVPVKLQLLQSTDVNIGFIYSTGALLIVFLQVPLINRLSEEVAPTKLIALGSMFLTVGLVIIGFTPNVVGIYVGVITFTFGQMFIQPMMSKQISEIAPLPLIASFFGFNGLALAVGGLIGNIVGGFLYDLGLSGYPSVPWICFWRIRIACDDCVTTPRKKREG